MTLLKSNSLAAVLLLLLAAPAFAEDGWQALCNGRHRVSNKVELNTHGKLLLIAPSNDRAATLGFRCVVDAAE